MQVSLYDVFRRYATGLLLIGILAGCQQPAPEPQPQPVVKAEKTHYSASDYIRHLALAKLDNGANQQNLQVINDYAAQKPRKPEYQGLVVLTYALKGTNNMQQTVAPVSLEEQMEFPSLQEVMTRLAQHKHTLHTLDVKRTRIRPDKALALPAVSNDSLQDVLYSHEKRLLDKAAALKPLENIRVQLNLIGFFTDHRFRDAAYLAVDNVKQSLALLQHDKAEDEEMIKAFSLRLEELESHLRNTLPFTL